MSKSILVIDNFIEDHIAELMIDFYDASATEADSPKLSKLDCGEPMPINELIGLVWEKQTYRKLSGSVKLGQFYAQSGLNNISG